MGSSIRRFIFMVFSAILVPCIHCAVTNRGYVKSTLRLHQQTDHARPGGPQYSRQQQTDFHATPTINPTAALASPYHSNSPTPVPSPSSSVRVGRPTPISSVVALSPIPAGSPTSILTYSASPKSPSAMTPTRAPKPSRSAKPIGDHTATPSPLLPLSPIQSKTAERTPAKSSDPKLLNSGGDPPPSTRKPLLSMVPTHSKTPTPLTSADFSPSKSADLSPSRNADLSPSTSAKFTPTLDATPKPLLSMVPNDSKTNPEPSTSEIALPVTSASTNPTTVERIEPTPTKGTEPTPSRRQETMTPQHTELTPTYSATSKPMLSMMPTPSKSWNPTTKLTPSMIPSVSKSAVAPVKHHEDGNSMRSISPGTDTSVLLRGVQLLYTGPQFDPYHMSRPQVLIRVSSELDKQPQALSRAQLESIITLGAVRAKDETQMLVLQTCKQSDEIKQAVDTVLYAFDADPRLPTAKLIAANDNYPGYNPGSKCAKSSRLEIPYARNSEIYVLITRREFVPDGRTSIASAIVRRQDLVPSALPWNVQFLAPMKGTRPRKASIYSSHLSAEGTSTRATKVYVLSSAPYLIHEELTSVQVEQTSYSDLPAPDSRDDNLVSAPFCNPMGTAMVAAIAGKTFGTGSPDANIISVPTSSCNTPLSEQSVLAALNWVAEQFTPTVHNNVTSLLVVEASSVLNSALSSGSLDKVITELKAAGIILVFPVSPCSVPSHHLSKLITVAPYGVDQSSRSPLVAKRSSSCLIPFDAYAPGLDVAAVGTFGPSSLTFLSNSPSLAASETVAMLTLVDSELHTAMNISNIKSALKNKRLLVDAAFTTKESKTSEILPLLGAGNSYKDLVNAINEQLSQNSISGSKSKALGGSIIPNLSNSVFYIICSAAAAVVAALVALAILAVKNHDTVDSEGSVTTNRDDDFDRNNFVQSEPTVPALGFAHDSENWTQRMAQNQRPSPGDSPSVVCAAQTSQTLPQTLDRKSPLVCAKDGSTMKPKKQTVDSNKQRKQKPVLERLMTLTRGEKIPETPGAAKASWFATPRATGAQLSRVFSSRANSTVNATGVADGTSPSVKP